MKNRTPDTLRIPSGTLLIRLREIASRLASLLTDTERHRLTRLILEEAEIQPLGVALVIGVGDGRLVAELARMATSGFVAGIDANEANIRRATRRNRAGLREGRVELLQADVTTLPYPDGMFDVVYVLESTRDVASASGPFHEIARVTRAGGTLLLGFPQAPPIPVRIETMRDRLRQVGYEDVIEVPAATAGQRVDFLCARLETPNHDNEAQNV